MRSISARYRGWSDVLDHVERYDSRNAGVREWQRLGERGAQHRLSAVLLDHATGDDEPDQRHVDSESHHPAFSRGCEQHPRPAAQIEESGRAGRGAEPAIELRRQPTGRDEDLPRAHVDLLRAASRLRHEHGAHHRLDRAVTVVVVQSRGRFAVVVHVDPRRLIDPEIRDPAEYPVRRSASGAGEYFTPGVQRATALRTAPLQRHAFVAFPMSAWWVPRRAESGRPVR